MCSPDLSKKMPMNNCASAKVQTGAGGSVIIIRVRSYVILINSIVATCASSINFWVLLFQHHWMRPSLQVEVMPKVVAPCAEVELTNELMD